MTPAELFKREMEHITKQRDISVVKRAGLWLILNALGGSEPEYLDGLAVFMNRLDDEPSRAPRQTVEPIA